MLSKVCVGAFGHTSTTTTHLPSMWCENIQLWRQSSHDTDCLSLANCLAKVTASLIINPKQSDVVQVQQCA